MSYVLFVDILFVVLFLGFVLCGIKRGFFAGFVRSFGWVLALISSYMFGPTVSSLCNRLFVKDLVSRGVFLAVEDTLSDRLGRVDADDLLSRFPRFSISESLRNGVERLLSEETTAHLKERLTEMISSPFSAILSGLIGYGITFAVSLVLLRVFASGVTEIAKRVAPLCAINRLLGGVWGALAGGVCLLALSALVKMFLRSSELCTESTVVRWFCDSAFLSFLN